MYNIGVGIRYTFNIFMKCSRANDVLFFLGMNLLSSTNDFWTKKLNQNHEKQLELPKEVLINYQVCFIDKKLN